MRDREPGGEPTVTTSAGATATQPSRTPTHQARPATDRTDRRWVRTAAVGGLVFFGLLMGFGSATSGSPAATDSRREVFDYVVRHHDRLQLAAALYALAMAAALVFASGLYAVLRDAWGGRSGPAVAALSGGVLAAAATLTGALVLGTTATRYADLGPAGTRVAWTSFLLSIGGTLVGQLVLLAATAVVSLRTGLFARWFAVASVLLALASVAGAFAVGYTASGFQVVAGVTVLLNSVWILVASLLLWRRPGLAVPD